jgi:hypothetical protein
VPFTIHHDSERGLLLVTATGPATPELFREVMGAITSGDHPPDADALWDLRGLDFGLVDGRFLRTMLALRRWDFAARGAARVALLVEDDLQYGVARQFELLSGDPVAGYAVFRSPEAALAWLRGG